MQVGLINEESCEFLWKLQKSCLPTLKMTSFGNISSKNCLTLSLFATSLQLLTTSDLDDAMARVFESNMSKLDESGKPIYRADGKVLKGPNYTAPDLTHCYPKPNILNDTHGK